MTAQFRYTARSRDGQIIEGSMHAASEQEVVENLRQKQLTITSVELYKARRSFSIPFVSSVKFSEKILVAEHLRVMIKAGMPIDDAIRVLQDQTRNAKLRDILEHVRNDVKQGKDLSSSFAKYPRVFSEMFTNMIHVGEQSGNLEQTLAHLTNQMRKSYTLRKKVRSAMTYPIIVLLALTGLVILMMGYVLPRVVDVFGELEVELPLATRVLIASSNFVNQNMLLVIGAVILFIVFLVWFRTTPVGKKIFHRIVLTVPPISNIAKRINLAQFSRTLGALISSGIVITTALDLTGDSMKNIWYRDALKRIALEIKKGTRMSDLIAQQPFLFPPVVVQIIRVGEETGSLSETIDNLAQYYEDESDATLDDLSSIIEPILMIVIGLGVGFVAVAIIAPIYSLVSYI
jgi:type IV pilus assembly protein PilC